MKLEITDFLPRCLGSVSDGTADCCSENMSAGDINEFWMKIELPGSADDAHVCTGVKATNCFMPKKTLSEKGLDGGDWIVMNKYMQVETRDGPVWGDSVLCVVGNCHYGCIGSQMISYPGEEQTTETLAVSLAVEIIEVPVIQTQEKTRQVANTHVQHVVNTVEVERPKLVKETVQEKINQVTKHIKIPQVQFLNKVDDMLVDVQRQIPVTQTMQKAMEVPPLQYVNRVVDVPVVAPRQISPMVQTVQKTIETQQLQCTDKVIDVPVVLVAQVSQLLSDVQAPTMQVVEKTVEDTVADRC